jgi:hypothetical protein
VDRQGDIHFQETTLPKFKSYKSFTRPLNVTLVNGEELQLLYCPAKYSGAFLEKTKRTERDAPMADEEFLAKILNSWDWTDEKDKPIPITAEFIREEVGIVDRRAMIEAIFKDVFPNDGTVTKNSSSSASAGTEDGSGLS